MTWKIFAAFGMGFVLLTAPAFSAPHHNHPPPPPNAAQQKPLPPASPPSSAFGAAAARRAQVLGRQDLAHAPLQYHPPAARPPAPTPPHMGFGGAYGSPSPISRQVYPITQGQFGPKTPLSSPSWGQVGATAPNRETAGSTPIHRPPNQNPKQWRQQHQYITHGGPPVAPGPQSRNGRFDQNHRYAGPGQNLGFTRTNPYQGYPRRRFYHRDTNHRWERSWEHDYNAYNRFHWRPYARPRGWYAQQWRFGMYLPYLFWTRNYWITNYWNFGLPQPPYGYIWVREGNNALLINEQDGYILQVIYNIFY